MYNPQINKLGVKQKTSVREKKGSVSENQKHEREKVSTKRIELYSQRKEREKRNKGKKT